ncbi:unnamed protein product [Orchesella dallaii]|uniref:CUB domain-containing protein n=1 Tax=Orchesella dallaii TaxID=48710 RepID=A0ABP1RZU2_9HEXA
MKSILEICLAFGLLATLCSTTVILNSEDNKKIANIGPRYNSPVLHTLNDSSLRCGEVLNSTSGGISYKAFEPIEPNERCVWIIRGGNTDGFNVNILYLGYESNPNGTQLIASCLRHYFEAFHIILNQTGPNPYLSFCNVLMITFSSGSNVGNSTGFVLQYEALGGGAVSPRSTDHIIQTGDPGVIKYPESAAEYDNNEFTTFVFEPTQNIFSPGKRINLIYIKGLMETSFDVLRVYVFNSNSIEPEKWEYKGVIDDNHNQTEIIFNQDLILVEFHSDRNNPGTGFQFIHTTSGVEGCNL